MDAEKRDRARLLKAALELGSGGSFFPMVDLLERLFPAAARVGYDGPARNEALRFRSDVSLGFPAGDIKSVAVERVPSELDRDRHVVRVETTFLGLTGTSSPLPNYIIEEILLEDGDGTVRRDFLDVFHHRLLSLLYRGVARTSLPREARIDSPSPWAHRVLAVAGIDAYEVAPTRKLPIDTVYRMLPLLAGRARSARSLLHALRHVLRPAISDQARVDILENLPGWLKIDPAQRLALGKANHALGVTTHIGMLAPERSGKFGIRIGPLELSEYTRFLPGGDQMELIRETVQLMTRNAVEYELELVISSDASPGFRLTATKSASLGRTTWLGGRPNDRTVTVPYQAHVSSSSEPQAEAAPP